MKGCALVSGWCLDGTPKLTSREIGEAPGGVYTMGHGRGAGKFSDPLTMLGVGPEEVCGFGTMASLRKPRKRCPRRDVMGC